MQINKSFLFSVVVIACSMSTVFYIVANNLPLGLGSFRFLWAPLTLILILVLKPQVYLHRPASLFIIYGFIFFIVLQNTLWKYMDEWNRRLLLEDFYVLIVFSAILGYFILSKDFNGFARVGKFGISFFILSIITSHIALFFDPMLIRFAASIQNLSNAQNELIKIWGAGGYGFLQSVVIFLPIILYYIKNPERSRMPQWSLLFFMFLVILLVIRANVMANFLILGIMFLYTWFGNSNKILTLCITMIFILFIFQSQNFTSELFLRFSGFFGSETFLSERLYDLGMFLKTSSIDRSTEAGIRAERYPLLINTFLNNPFFGIASRSLTDYPKEAGHIYWMNKLALIGLIGFVFYVFIMYSTYRLINKMMNDKIRFYNNMAWVTYIFFGLIKNIDNREPIFILFVLIPAFFSYNNRN